MFYKFRRKYDITDKLEMATMWEGVEFEVLGQKKQPENLNNDHSEHVSSLTLIPEIGFWIYKATKWLIVDENIFQVVNRVNVKLRETDGKLMSCWLNCAQSRWFSRGFTFFLMIILEINVSILKICNKVINFMELVIF